jgi:energy-coupling factor transporter ATP-binding protein EcfA2
VIAYNNRVLVIGPTRSGKSELLNVLASGLRNQWALVDPKDEFAIAGVPKVYDVDELDFAEQRILHWVPPDERRRVGVVFPAGQRAQARGAARALHGGRARGRLLSCEFRPNKVGPQHNTFLSQGEAWGLGGWYASQRPACLPTFATSEPTVTVAFAEKLARDDDHKTLAAAMSLPPQQLADAQAHVLAVHGRHAARLSSTANAGAVTGMAPLPERLLRQNIVRRRTVE